MKQKKNLRQIFSVFLTCMMIIGVALANDHIFVEGEGKPQAEQQVQEGEPQQEKEQEQQKPQQGEIQEGKPQQEPEQGQEPGQQEQGQGDSGKSGELPGKPEEVKQRGGQELQVKITDFNVTNADGKEPADGFIANQIFRLNYKWEVSNSGNALKEGDYFELELPDKFKFPLEVQYSKFEVHAANGDVVANAVITPKEPGGGKIKVTFTNYVNGKSSISGDMHLTARWNQTTYSITGPVDHDIVVGSITKTIKIRPYKKPNYETEVIYKTAGGTLTGEGWVRWRIRVNAKQGNLTNVVIKDNLWAEAPGNPKDIEYVSDQFILYELSWNAGKNEFDEINGKNVSKQINISQDKRSFTYNMGNMNGKGYILHYRTTYKQGLLLKNRVELKSDKENPEPAYGEFLDAQAGGGALPEDALKGRIKIIKVAADDDSVKLENAKFKITRKASGASDSSFEIKTDENGVAVTMPLLPGEYEIKEIEAPDKYVKNNTEYTVTVADDKVTEQKITNEPETRDITVKKEWIGFEQPLIKAVLYANGTKVAGQELKAPDWEYTFKNFRVYDKTTGKKIIYTVDEEVVPTGYERSITGSPEDGFVITNKQKTIDIKGEKTWVDNNNAGNTRPEFITVILYANGHQIQNPDVRPDANDKWLYSFEGLQEYDDQGDKITYTIKEKPVPGYTSEVNGYNITNKKTPNPGGGGSGGGQSGGGSGGTGGDDSNKPKPNDPKPNNPKPNNPTQNGPTPSDDSTGMGGATPPDSSVMPDGSVVPNDSTTATNTVAPKNQKMPKNPVLTDKQGVKKTAQAGRRLPKTGEGANPTLYAWMLGALGSMLVLVGYRKRKTVK